MGGKGYFRKILIQCFEFCSCSHYHTLIFDKNKLDFAVPEFNSESIGTILKCKKLKKKSSYAPFIQGSILRFLTLLVCDVNKNLMKIYFKNEK